VPDTQKVSPGKWINADHDPQDPEHASDVRIKPVVVVSTLVGEMTGYLRIHSHPPGARVEVHQIVDTTEQAEFMERAWAMVLGRLQAGVVRASDPDSPMPLRPGRPKQWP
jgi:hypothetical protein